MAYNVFGWDVKPYSTSSAFEVKLVSHPVKQVLQSQCRLLLIGCCIGTHAWAK